MSLRLCRGIRVQRVRAGGTLADGSASGEQGRALSAALPPAAFAERMARPLLLDGRRAFDATAMRNAGVEYRAIGLGGSE